jgi:hypothetical protein
VIENGQGNPANEYADPFGAAAGTIVRRKVRHKPSQSAPDDNPKRFQMHDLPPCFLEHCRGQAMELLAGEKADNRQCDRADGRASFAIPETIKAAKKENYLYSASGHCAT